MIFNTGTFSETQKDGFNIKTEIVCNEKIIIHT